MHIEHMRYIILLRRYKKGRNEKTRYSFYTLYEAREFVRGYLAALHDVDITHIYLTILDTNTGKCEVYS